jgi:hypothetical protein
MFDWIGQFLPWADNEFGNLAGQTVTHPIGWGCPINAWINTIRSSYPILILGYINYFIPIQEMLVLLGTWVLAINGYYIYSIVLRWAKAIS